MLVMCASFLFLTNPVDFQSVSVLLLEGAEDILKRLIKCPKPEAFLSNQSLRFLDFFGYVLDNYKVPRAC